ncbi:SH3 domain-containing protein [Ruegeria arenilitoris]|uniref:SH3 domain-containing protein n=1 Tax=Ruegeria arenilitoris TaxID=1173585 RepID=UPI00147F3779|nr:SH3 domain-containing protein [Ruegeria arenilitoris]
MKIFLTVVFSLLTAGAALSQQIVKPTGPAITDTGCLVKGLNPNGDGFLALRTGPGSSYQQIGSLRNGDAAYIRACDGKWCYVENGAINNVESKFRGWIHTGWCEFYP